MPTGVVVRWLDGCRVLIERRIPLARLAPVESVPIIKSFAGRPAIERTRSTQLMIRRTVPLTEGGGAVGIAPENLGNAGRLLWPLSVIAREARGHLSNRAGMNRMVIAS